MPSEKHTKISAQDHTVFLSVGSNMGDALAHCRFGISRMAAQPEIAVTATSPFYRTAPVDFADQDWFVNAAFRIATRLDPHELLKVTQTVQAAAGQGAKAVRFGPRILDLDLIFYDQVVLKHADLELPHPRMHERRFVLQPICDIDPQFVHPKLGCTVQDLLQYLEVAQQEVVRIDA